MTHTKSLIGYFSSYFYLLLVCTSLGQADRGNAQPSPAAANGRVVYFACTGFPKGMENPVLIRSGKKIVSLGINKRLVSDPVKVSKDGIIELVRKSSDGEDEYTVIARAKASNTARKSLVVLTPVEKLDEKNPTKLFHTKIFDLANFKGGDNLYINLSPYSVICKIGDKKLQIKPLSQNIFHPENLQKSTNMPVQYGYLDNKTKQWRLLSASTMVLRPTRREICVFSWNQKYKRVGYHGITFPLDPPKDQP